MTRSTFPSPPSLFLPSPLHFSDCWLRTSSNEEIKAVGAQPHILSLEDASVKDFVSLFDKEKPDGVVFSAGAGGKGGEERTKAVDYEGGSCGVIGLFVVRALILCGEGAIKIFDALEASNTHRIVMVSAADLRGMSHPTFFPSVKSDVGA